jgi:hypothetical protein
MNTSTTEALRELVEEYELLRAKHHRLRDAVIAVCDELEEQYDYADDTGPNWAMRIGTELKEGLYGPGGF